MEPFVSNHWIVHVGRFSPVNNTSLELFASDQISKNISESPQAHILSLPKSNLYVKKKRPIST
jgi:hypothetical protein